MKLPRWMRAKENPVMRAVLAVLGWSDTAWSAVSYDSLAKAGYEQNPWVYACVRLIAQSASRINWVLQRRSRGDMVEVDEHQLLTLLARPNEFESGARLTEKVFAYLLLAGNSYVLKVHGVPSAPPRFLYSLRPDRMTIEKSKDFKNPIGGYIYSVGSDTVKLATGDVLHLLEFHPTDDWYGLSRIQVAARQVDIAAEAAEWNKKLLENDMRPPGLITAKGAITQADIDMFRRQFSEAYGGYKNAGTPLVFSGDDVKYDPLSIAPRDVEWLDGQKLVMRQICSVFGVASELLGDSENKTYSNIQEARRALYMETVLPLMDMYRDELNNWLTPLFGDDLRLDYDRDGIEALQEEREKKYAYLANARWLTLNEQRQACGYEDIPGGDVILVPLSEIPLGAAVGGEAQTEGKRLILGKKGSDAAAAASTRQKFWRDPERKERLWESYKARVDTRERSFTRLAEAYLKEQRDALLARIRKHSSVGSIAAESVFDLNQEQKRYRDTFLGWYRDHFRRGGEAGMRAAKGELFDDAQFKADPDKPTSWMFQMTPELEEVVRRLVLDSGSKVNETTKEKIYQLLKGTQEANETVEQFTQRVWESVEFEVWRARLWARTESAKVDNYGQLEGYRQTEFVGKRGWLCSFVPESREAHMEVDGTELPLDEPFLVGGERLMYPGDPAGSAGNVCNCLCTTYPVMEG